MLLVISLFMKQQVKILAQEVIRQNVIKNGANDDCQGH